MSLASGGYRPQTPIYQSHFFQFHYISFKKKKKYEAFFLKIKYQASILSDSLKCRWLLGAVTPIVFPPAPKKGMVKFSRKGHFQRAATCKEGTFKRARHAKRALLSPLVLSFLQSCLLFFSFPIHQPFRSRMLLLPVF